MERSLTFYQTTVSKLNTGVQEREYTLIIYNDIAILEIQQTSQEYDDYPIIECLCKLTKKSFCGASDHDTAL